MISWYVYLFSVGYAHSLVVPYFLIGYTILPLTLQSVLYLADNNGIRIDYYHQDLSVAFLTAIQQQSRNRILTRTWKGCLQFIGLAPLPVYPRVLSKNDVFFMLVIGTVTKAGVVSVWFGPKYSYHIISKRASSLLNVIQATYSKFPTAKNPTAPSLHIPWIRRMRSDRNTNPGFPLCDKRTCYTARKNRRLRRGEKLSSNSPLRKGLLESWRRISFFSCSAQQHPSGQFPRNL